MAEDDSINLDTSQITNWRSIVTLVVFVITNIIVLLPFRVPFYVPRILWSAILDVLSALRIISPEHGRSRSGPNEYLVKFKFPLNFVTAPLIADLFLLAILAIGRQEVHDGTLGAHNISPIDIMVFFISLAYIAISIDASGLIRYLAFRVLQWGGNDGYRLYFYLYAFFFALTSFIGNDPVILSGTAFLAYMTRVSNNIVHPRAWIYTQFATANMGSAILVSSNPTNLVLAGAFNIKFVNYTANMIVPVIATAICLFPFLLYIVFKDEALIPRSIGIRELTEEAKRRAPVNPNIPNARAGIEEQDTEFRNGEEVKVLSLEEIMNPFVDRGGAAFGGIIMAVTLITLLALNAASEKTGEHPVFWVTLPAAVITFTWDVASGWIHREETRKIARDGRQARVERDLKKQREAEEEAARQRTSEEETNFITPTVTAPTQPPSPEVQAASRDGIEERKNDLAIDDNKISYSPSSGGMDEKKQDIELEDRNLNEPMIQENRGNPNLVSLLASLYQWCQETFPTATAVAAHLPYALVPFAFSMFVLVQALVTKGWVPVFAHGWDHWVNKTGTLGGVGGMGFLSVVLCNFAGTNIGTTILLSRVIQAWQEIHRLNGIPISNRTFWATVYSMAIGVNYGAFSAAFSASLAGLLWRDILGKKHIHVKSRDFARVNLPIIAIAMIVGCVVLVAEVYIMRDNKPYNM